MRVIGKVFHKTKTGEQPYAGSNYCNERHAVRLASQESFPRAPILRRRKDFLLWNLSVFYLTNSIVLIHPRNDVCFFSLRNANPSQTLPEIPAHGGECQKLIKVTRLRVPGYRERARIGLLWGLFVSQLTRSPNRIPLHGTGTRKPRAKNTLRKNVRQFSVLRPNWTKSSGQSQKETGRHLCQ